MQQQLINLNPDLQQLLSQGYDIEIKGGHLVVRHIPYVNPSKQLSYGMLVCVLNYSSPTKLSPPPDHTIYFAGATPCNKNGQPLTAIINNSNRQQLTGDIAVDHYFSSRPITGNYPNYYEKIRTYSEIISIHAKAIDGKATAKPNKQTLNN